MSGENKLMPVLGRRAALGATFGDTDGGSSVLFPGWSLSLVMSGLVEASVASPLGSSFSFPAVHNGENKFHIITFDKYHTTHS